MFSKQDEEILVKFLATLAPLLQQSQLFRSSDSSNPRSSNKEQGEYAFSKDMEASNTRTESLRATIKHEILEVRLCEQTSSAQLSSA